ncbi:phosphoglycerate dehydrogenase-like enzyme [Silvibacterium bohemicum]|uniref:Phosphoglycerate dehydrogenase-like enzyme n=1 Tax=Silvibacterium bohemicum TaxID=1577686 RepID=A0A841K3A4_9BACT|nr:2-hydroxyacid dehydrogenase [Silvibacterium bohemicum]MBB6145641.1 phosphoglycerate dehydrogenase-like enzyme [Silvibacterium bohemicum]
MLKVGVPSWIDEHLFAKFPSGVSIQRMESNLTRDLEVEFLVAYPSVKGFQQALPHLHGLRVVQAMTAGVDWLKKLVPEGLVLCDGQGMHNIPTAEWTITAILSSLKFFPFYRDLQHTGEWQRLREADTTYRQLHRNEQLTTFKVLQEELYGKRVMIVGYGSIGKSIEERLLAFGVDIVRVARSARDGVEAIERLPELLPQVDVVVLIVPLTEETTGMIGARELALMKQGALLVNAARGPVVQTDALVEALQSGRIRAAFDVTDPEPLPQDHPLWSAPNLLLTPHIAGSTPRSMERAITFAAEQAGRYQRGEPLQNVVTGNY